MGVKTGETMNSKRGFPPIFGQLKLLDFGKILAKAWAEAWLLLASALYSSDSRVRACLIIIANVPSNDPNVDAPANVPAPANLENAPAQPIGHGDGFHPWVGGNILNNQNGWME
ncbi:hypothetical protein Tco_0869189 [Tanacetum coccineum]